LADQVNRADVDAQCQRSRGHKRLQFAALQAIFGIEAQLRRQAAMM